jgi:hypothetical protein
MARPEWFQRLVAVAVLAAFVGCAEQPAGNPVAADPANDPGIQAAAAAVAEVVSTPAPAPGDPVSAVKVALGAVQQGRLEQAYDFLPPSYQQDIDQLVGNFAVKMDAEVWSAAFTVLRKAVDVLKTKQDMVLALIPQGGPQGPNPAATEQLRQNWGDMVQSLELVIASDISDLERLKNISTRRYLATTGNKFFAQMQVLSAAGGGGNPLDELKKTTVELVSHDGNQAVLRIKGSRDPNGQEQPFVQVDGRWIPQSLADDWADHIQKAKDQLEQITPELVAAQKGKALEHLKVVEQTLDGMLSAQKPEEFQAAVLPLVLQFSMLGRALTPAGPPPGSVTIFIDRELSEQEETKVLDDLVKQSDNPERTEFTSSKSDGRTRIVLDNVSNVAKFAEKLKVGSAKSVDLSLRTIQLELKAE